MKQSPTTRAERCALLLESIRREERLMTFLDVDPDTLLNAPWRDEFPRSPVTAKIMAGLVEGTHQPGEHSQLIDGVQWLVMTAKKWAEQCGCSEKQVQRVLAQLENQGYVRKVVKRDDSGAPTLHVRPNAVKVLAVLARHGIGDQREVAEAERRIGNLPGDDEHCLICHAQSTLDASPAEARWNLFDAVGSLMCADVGEHSTTPGELVKPRGACELPRWAHELLNTQGDAFEAQHFDRAVKLDDARNDRRRLAAERLAARDELIALCQKVKASQPDRARP